MRTDFYERYKAGCSEKYPNYENLLHHCCEQVKSSVTDVFTNYFMYSFKKWPFETNTCMQVQLGKLALNYEYCDHSSGCRFMLTVGMNHILEQLNEYLLKTTKTGLKDNQC